MQWKAEIWARIQKQARQKIRNLCKEPMLILKFESIPQRTSMMRHRWEQLRHALVTEEESVTADKSSSVKSRALGISRQAAEEDTLGGIEH